ncbi:MAG: anthranilate phosphoribosyltransferase [Verrucomicrobia bacterium]|nr:anthranilate phosphoribosyltransferase [Verrucomicrobiota bacterium]
MKDLIEQLRSRVDLRLDQARQASRQLADPAVSELDKGDFLVALKLKGESGEELGYFARSFLELAIRPDLQLDDKPSIDIVGTGGDRLELINVSTTCIFLLAAAGVVVLKHGNRAITSKAGAADVLETLGIPIACPPEKMADCVHHTGIGFFFAPLYHPAFRLVAPIRRKLAEQGIATLFNLLGPLLNPAEPTCQLTGVFSPTILERYAVALREVGRSRAWVVHGRVLGGSGMDEISLLGETEVHEVKGNALNQFYLFPDQLGFRKPSVHELRGGDPTQNARALMDILANRDRGAKRDLITINAAAGLVIAGAVPRMESGIHLANEILDSGRALEKLREFQRFFASPEHPAPFFYR